MPSSYLQPGEYAAYGLPSSTAAGDVAQASTLIDAFLGRPEGLVWAPDGAGLPCYMAGLVGMGMALTAPGAISPGQSVAVPVTGPGAAAQVGDVLILDRATSGLTEAVTVISSTPTSVTLRSVANAHGGGALLEAGLVIQEQKMLPANRPLTMLAQTPVARILSGTGRYGYARRGDMGVSSIDDFNLLAALSHFGGPPVWEVFDPAGTDVDPITGQLWVPAGIMLAYYTEVRVRYVAGFSAAGLPPEVKMATARTVQALANAPSLGAVKSYKAGGYAVENFASTLLSDDLKAQLQRYMARAFA